MKEPANDNQQAVAEAGDPPSAGEEPSAIQRAPVVAAIPTVAPSQRLPSVQSDAGGAELDDAGVEARAARDAEPPRDGDAAGAGVARTEVEPIPEAAVWHQVDPEPSREVAPAPFFVEARQAAAEPAAGARAHDPAPAVIPPEQPQPEAASETPSQTVGSQLPEGTALVREEEVWSSPEAAATHIELASHAATTALPATSQDAAHLAAGAFAPAEARTATGATQADPSSWRPRFALAAPAGAVPSDAGHAPIDWLSHLRRAGIVVGAAIAALVVSLLLLILAYRWVDPPTSALMLSQRLAGTTIEHAWVPLDGISPNLVHAVILSEDGGFCRHRGVDWAALTQAIEDDRGGSTITMQVVKNLFLWPARSYVRKALEIMLAYLVEIVWPKERVLEIYLNIAEWGPGIFGAEAAARQHFGKPAARLTAQEAALLAVALPSPLERESGYPGYQQRRLASNLLTRMRAVRMRPCVHVARGSG